MIQTKIVATVGPATASAEGVAGLIAAGASVLRVNFAHQDPDMPAQIVRWARAAADEAGRAVAVLGDLAGPKIRVGTLTTPIPLEAGQLVVFAPEGAASDDEIPTTYAALAADVAPGCRILLDDGLIETTVESVQDGKVLARVSAAGLLRSKKGMNLPGVSVSAPALSDKDRADARIALEAGVEFLGLSFVQRAGDIADLRTMLPQDGPQIVAKIEKDTALAELGAILGGSDAVMVARGDLGVELPYEEVPAAQTRIISCAAELARPVIVATQMLESMISAPRPTRAEASDVANAVRDGADAVMLSGETAVGTYPIEAVRAMKRIIAETEKVAHLHGTARHYTRRLDRRMGGQEAPTEEAVAHASVDAVRLINAPFLVCVTATGLSARLLASYRPPVPILAVSPNPATVRRLALVRGVHGIHVEGEGYRQIVGSALAYIRSRDLARRGQRVVVTSGFPEGQAGTTNTFRVETL